MEYLKQPELKQVRTLMRNLLKAGRLEARTTYRDYYDSCHAPTETPNAPWIKGTKLLTKDDFKSGGGCLSVAAGIWRLSTGYKVMEVRVIGGAR